MSRTTALLAREAEALGVEIDPGVLAKYDAYLALLNKWSGSTNVVGASDPDELVRYHLADSLAVVPHLGEAGRLVDVGSGAGFPGAVIAVLRPDLEVTALEPIHKKHAFLSALRRELALRNFDPRPERDEAHRVCAGFRPYDAAVSRATWSVDEWLTRGARLVRAGGLVLGMEGREQIELPPGAVRHPYRLGDRTRAIVLLRTGPAGAPPGSAPAVP